MNQRLTAALILLGFLSGARAASCQELDPSMVRSDPSPAWVKILSEVRRATGQGTMESNSASVTIRSRSRDSRGTESVVTTTFASRGRFAQEVQGPVAYRSGFDGGTAWREMWGVGEELALGGRESMLGGIWFRNGYWLDPEAPLSLSLESGEAEDEPIRIRMMLHWGLLSWEISVDRTTWLPREASVLQMGRPSVIRLSDYADFDGRQVPRRVTVLSGETVIRDSVTESVVTGTLQGGDLFAPRVGPPEDTRFDAKMSPRLQVKRTAFGNRLLINPRINGKDVGWFLFDTGAGGWTITPDAAEEAGLEIVGRSHSSDPSGIPVALDTCRARSVRLGPATFEDQIFRAVDLLKTDDGYVGLIGHGLFGRCVVEYDGLGGEMSLHDPEEYELAGGSWQEMVPGQRVPTIEATFEGHKELFRVDTGSSSWIVFNTPCVERLGLLEGRETRAIEVTGGVGRFTIRQGAIDWFELGGRRFESVEAEFSTMKTGVLADPFTAGLINNRLLDPFKLVLDYRHDRIAFLTRE